MGFQSNNDAFFNYPPQHTYLLFLKLEEDINKNNCVPFYFLPKEEKEHQNNYRYRATETLTKEMFSVIAKYVNNNNTTIQTYTMNSESAFLKKFSYNSFDIFYFKYKGSIIILNYFKVGQCIESEIFMHNTNLDPDNDHRHDITIYKKHYKAINTHIPFCEYCKTTHGNNSSQNINLSLNLPFWEDVENFSNNMNSKMGYLYHTIEDENLVIVYDGKPNLLNQNSYNQGF